jgi:hypothetical protein
MQPANPAANAASNAPTTQLTQLMLRATSPTTQLTLPQTKGKTQEPNLHQCKLTTLKVVSVDV